MEAHGGVQINMAAQPGGSICAPVLHGSSFGGPVTLIYLIHGGQGGSSSSSAQTGSPAAPELTHVQVNSISISSTKEQTTISLCDGEVTVLIKPKPKGRVRLEEETLCIIGDFYQGYRSRNQHPASDTLSRVVEGMLHKHSVAYSGMVQRLCLEQQDDSMEFISSVAKTLFDDGITNWGRIASLVALGAVVCEWLKEVGREQCVENVIQHISMYLSTDQRQWLINNKAWAGFVEFFREDHREDHPESCVWNALMSFVIGGGVGVGISLLMR
ncbi:induced myeloid leukemia cell differentiation protein Mcl-1 homolog [Pygocentrus nattereri]|uniref:induced myeloid leukemia cell differentiation protein Mcl-1 homolog n=1 Tax=Pygocentrus nattereri TaxID=42514 RepID=UPI001891482A|nr:induced myeloid leukemia cell differentiation protein Mcl-1 homolog [Pygocentrus nattereri]